MQNRPDSTQNRELEVSVTSAGTNGRDVTIYTPWLSPNDPCYFMLNDSIQGFGIST